MRRAGFVLLAAFALWLGATALGDEPPIEGDATPLEVATTTPVEATTTPAAPLTGALTPGTPPADVPRPGDVFWLLRPRGVFADERVAIGVAYLVDSEPVLEAAGIGDNRLWYHQLDPLPPAEAPVRGRLLLAAAGLDDGSTLTGARACTVWAPTGSELLTAGARAVGEQLAAALTSFGVPVDACELVEDSTDADVFIWAFGQDLHVDASPAEPEVDSFIVLR